MEAASRRLTVRHVYWPAWRVPLAEISSCTTVDHVPSLDCRVTTTPARSSDVTSEPPRYQLMSRDFNPLPVTLHSSRIGLPIWTDSVPDTCIAKTHQNYIFIFTYIYLKSNTYAYFSHYNLLNNFIGLLCFTQQRINSCTFLCDRKCNTTGAVGR